MARPVERRLAAIMAADVVGYSRLMAADEEGTHARLKALRKDFIEPEIAAHRGRMVKLMGDGALVEFASAVDAVECAVATQKRIAEHQADAPEEQRIAFRIGINVGDVIFEDDDIYGDGVNVAARLEQLSEPGGVCVSELVRLSTEASLDLAFEDLGEQQVKNIARAVRAWRWRADVASHPAAPREPPPAENPSLAVLPFDNLSHDPEQEYFSDGITEDLITDLSQISELFVSSRHSVFQYKNQPTTPQRISQDLAVRYVLEGSVRRAGSRVRINAQLIDGKSGYHLWAERYDRDLEDIFALQDEITTRIVEALKVKLTESERDSLARRYTDNLEAYDLFLRARESHLLRRSKEDAARVREALEQAIELDPGFAAAFALLAENWRQEWLFGWREDDGMLDRALELAEKAVRLDDDLPLAHMLLGWVHLWRGEHDPAIAEMERSVALDPDDAEARVRLGHILDHAGRPEEGVPLIERGMQLDPHHPFLYPFWLGHALQSLERYEEAIAAYRRVVSRNPDFIGVHQQLAAAYAQLGRMEQARAEATEVVRLNPGFSLRRHAEKIPHRDQAVVARFVEGMRKAGLPE